MKAKLLQRAAIPVIVSKTATSPEQITQWAKGWEGACFSPRQPGHVEVEVLDWQEVRHFDLHLIDGFDAGFYDDLADGFDERERTKGSWTPEEADRYLSSFRDAIRNGTIEEIFVAQGTDGGSYVWEGNHRVGVARSLGVYTLPAFVGYQRIKAARRA